MNEQTPSKSDQESRKVEQAARELEHNALKSEQELEDTKDLVATRNLLGRLQVEKKTNKDTRLAKKLFAKTQKPRVLKPKPKRRPNKRVAVLSIGGQNVEDEDAFQEIN